MRAFKLFKSEEDIAGLDINYGRIVASHFSVHGDQQVLDRLAVETYDPNLPATKLAATIRKVWKQNKMPTRTVRTCLHSRSLVIRHFQYKNLSSEELPQVLSLEAEEALQQSPEKISLDWQLNQTSEESSPELSGTLVAAPRKTVAHHINLIKAAGLYSVHVEVSCCALNNLYAFLEPERAGAPVCLINLAERTADIIMRSGNNNYPRALFSAGERWDDNTDYLLENIQNALLYHHLKAKQHPIEKIVLVGRIPNPEVFPDELSKKASLPVEMMDLCNNKHLTDDQIIIPTDHFKKCNLATGIGLGLRRTADEIR